MKPEDINRAIAEHCGWQFLPERDTRLGPQPELWESPDGDRYFESPLKDWPPYPNYHEDLNAMHEAEKTLTDKGWRLYVIKLARVIAKQPNINVRVQVPTNVLIGAKAEERAEAFLRTIGKWKDQ